MFYEVDKELCLFISLDSLHTAPSSNDRDDFFDKLECILIERVLR